VNDLDTRLERLAAAATRDAVPPELASVARRGRRRRRRQLAGTAALVAAVVAAGLVLPARLAPRPLAGDPDRDPAPATDVSGADRLGGYWVGKADVSVFLEPGIDEARRRAIRQRIEALDVVDAVFYESRQAAYDRHREQFRSRPDLLRSISPSVLPESFRVRLDAPEHVKQLLRALCPLPSQKTREGKPACIDGVDSVVDARPVLEKLFVAKPWAATSDITVLLLKGLGQAQVRAIEARLKAIDGVARVAYEPPGAAYRRLAPKVRTDLLPRYTARQVPASLRVTLREPVRVGAVHRALCGSRRTGACGDAIVVLEHPRRTG
jgi:cell division protein FtsX